MKQYRGNHLTLLPKIKESIGEVNGYCEMAQNICLIWWGVEKKKISHSIFLQERQYQSTTQVFIDVTWNT